MMFGIFQQKKERTMYQKKRSIKQKHSKDSQRHRAIPSSELWKSDSVTVKKELHHQRDSDNDIRRKMLYRNPLAQRYKDRQKQYRESHMPYDIFSPFEENAIYRIEKIQKKQRRKYCGIQTNRLRKVVYRTTMHIYTVHTHRYTKEHYHQSKQKFVPSPKSVGQKSEIENHATSVYENKKRKNQICGILFMSEKENQKSLIQRQDDSCSRRQNRGTHNAWKQKEY